MIESLSELLTTKALAERWGCTVGHLRNLRLAGHGPAHTVVGKQALYSLESVREFEASGQRDAWACTTCTSTLARLQTSTRENRATGQHVARLEATMTQQEAELADWIERSNRQAEALREAYAWIDQASSET